MVCVLAKGSGDCDITRIPWPSGSAVFAEPLRHYPNRCDPPGRHRLPGDAELSRQRRLPANAGQGLL